MCRVSRVNGAHITTTSEPASRSVSSRGENHASGKRPSGSPVPAGQYPRSSRRAGSRLHASTRIANAVLAMRASSRPMLP